MAILDADFATTDLNSVEEDGGIRSTPTTRLEHEPRDWQSLYEQAHARAERERGRADAAEARCEELRWAEVAARTDAGSWKSRFKSCRRRLSEAEEETKELRRAAKDVPSLQSEVARLKTSLSEAGIESSATGKVEALRSEIVGLRRTLAVHILAKPARQRRHPRLRRGS